jgi:hypothetical protein
MKSLRKTLKHGLKQLRKLLSENANRSACAIKSRKRAYVKSIISTRIRKER